MYKTITTLTGFLIAQFFFTSPINAQLIPKVFRFPAIYDNQVIFTYAGDLFSVSDMGGVATKLTSHDGFETFPRFSPDGQDIAFTGQYDGNTEVYRMPAKGGFPVRLTYTSTLHRDDISDRMGPNNITMAWTPDGAHIIYRSRKQSFNDFVGQLFKVSKNGGLSEELPLPAGGFCSYSADGKKMAYNRVFREFRTWKYYKGGMADDVWIYDFDTRQTVNITNNLAQDIIPMWYKTSVYFISDRDRTMNLFCYNLETKVTMKLTEFKDFDIKFPSLGTGKIVFENGGAIYVYVIDTKELRKLNIEIYDDGQYMRPQLKDASKNLTSVQLSPDAKRLVVSGRGDVFSIPATEGVTRNLTHSSGAHDRNATWSPDGQSIAWISDAGSEFEIYTALADGTGKPIQLTENSTSYMYHIKWSPDCSKIAWCDRNMGLYYTIVETKKSVVVDRSNQWEMSDFNWSPDSKWLTYTKKGNNRFNEVFIYNIESKKITLVTDTWYESSRPTFSSDGKYLLFVSQREFNPIYNEVEWNTAYSDMEKIYLITLSAKDESPIAPKNDEVKDSIVVENDDRKKEKPFVGNVVIDTIDISHRIVSLQIRASNYYEITCFGGKVYYIENGSKNKPSAKMYDLVKREEIELGDYDRLSFSYNNKKVLLKKADKYYICDVPKKEVKVEKPVDFSGMKVIVDLQQEWKQIYYETWRQMRDFFYDPGMHGVDWAAQRDKYAVFLPGITHRDDLNYVLGELVGELNVGHAYVGNGDRPSIDRINMGLLGAKVSKHSSGYFKVVEVLKGQNWDSKVRSPLTEVGREVKAGEYILCVNGQDTKQLDDIYKALVNTDGKQVELIVNTKPDLAGSRKIIIVPVNDESSLYYYNWVQSNIGKVNKATNGQVGYIHVPNMLSEGLNEFMKYFYPQLNKKALIIDDRGNGGGNVSPMLIERLRREITRSNMLRNSTAVDYTPHETMLGPKVLLVNNYSASDGDLFPYSFKKHNIGKVIGMRTWGGVVGIRGSLPFIDGGSLTKPEFASYSSEKSEWIIEGYGVDPDIVIDNDPAKEYAGEDQQLNKAIEVILEELKNRGPKIPPIPEFPDKSK